MKNAKRLARLGIAAIAFWACYAAAQTTPLFSPDAKKYLEAREATDGRDLTFWRVYASGSPDRLLWRGYDGFLAKHPKLGYEYYIAHLSNPRWNAKGELEATLTCSAHARTSGTTVKLTQQGKKWSWQPVVDCPHAP